MGKKAKKVTIEEYWIRNSVHGEEGVVFICPFCKDEVEIWPWNEEDAKCKCGYVWKIKTKIRGEKVK